MKIITNMIATLKKWFGIEEVPAYVNKVKELNKRIEKAEQVNAESKGKADILVPGKKKFVPLSEEKQKAIDKKVKDTIAKTGFANGLKEEVEVVTKISGEQAVVKKKKYYRKPKNNPK